MSVELIEIIKQQIAALSPQEKSELLRYLQEQAKQDAPSPSPDNDDAAQRAALLREIAKSMKANSFTGDPPCFSREELHERR